MPRRDPNVTIPSELTLPDIVRHLVISEIQGDAKTGDYWLLNFNRFNSPDDVVIPESLAQGLLALQDTLCPE